MVLLRSNYLTPSWVSIIGFWQKDCSAPAENKRHGNAQVEGS